MSWRPVTARPLCGTCKKRVERLEEDADPAWGRVRFRAYCHGAVETVTIEMNGLAGVDPSLGVAFAPQRLLEEADRV